MFGPEEGTPPYSIRAGTALDQPWLVALGRSTAEAARSVLRPVSGELAAAAFERHLQLVMSHEHEVLIAEKGGERAGFLLVIYDIPDQVTGERVALFSYLVIAPPFRQQGLGEALARQGLAHARRRGCRFGTGVVSTGNGSAQRLYEKLGWQVERLEMVRPIFPTD